MTARSRSGNPSAPEQHMVLLLWINPYLSVDFPLQRNLGYCIHLRRFL
jgi:hypothetical protein